MEDCLSIKSNLKYILQEILFSSIEHLQCVRLPTRCLMLRYVSGID